MACNLENILLIANPASQNGHGAFLAERAVEALFHKMSDSEIEVILTKHPKHATDIAADSASFDTVIVLGGDGIVHEAVNGIMQLPRENRPQFGVIPTGSGNDFARALGMPKGLTNACNALCSAASIPSDVGCANGIYFAETFSFGLDAAIALDTVERRRKTGLKGTPLYAMSAIYQLKHSFRSYEYTMCVDGSSPEEGESYTFAIQNGPYYGGGFKICPEAKLDDGLLDVCISHPPIGRPAAVRAFALAKEGKHTHIKQLQIFQAKNLEITFNEEPPCQIDGEKLTGTTFNVQVKHDAIRFLTPQRRGGLSNNAEGASEG